MLAPIGLSVYGRVEHTRKTIEALKRNTLAKESTLYIFSDAPKPGDEEKVARMREYIRTVDGFKEIHLIERTENSRVKNNRGGMKFLLDKYGKMIFMEEDVVTAPGFLQFMNDALEFYENTQMIGCISAYCPPIAIPRHPDKDFFTLTPMNPWGFGLWRDYFKIDTPISEEEFTKIYSDKKNLKKLKNAVGEAAVKYIQMDFEGKADAGDMKCIFWQYVDDKLTIYPKKSLVHNIGQDNSGVHMGETNKWDVHELWDKVDGFEFSDDIAVDVRILKAHNQFYKIKTFKAVLIKILMQLGIYQAIRPAAKFVQNRLRQTG
jgi:hypothetical protein